MQQQFNTKEFRGESCGMALLRLLHFHKPVGFHCCRHYSFAMWCIDLEERNGTLIVQIAKVCVGALFSWSVGGNDRHRDPKENCCYSLFSHPLEIGMFLVQAVESPPRFQSGCVGVFFNGLLLDFRESSEGHGVLFTRPFSQKLELHYLVYNQRLFAMVCVAPSESSTGYKLANLRKCF